MTTGHSIPASITAHAISTPASLAIVDDAGLAHAGTVALVEHLDVVRAHAP